MLELDEEECVGSLFGLAIRKDRAESAVYSGTVVQRTARLWVVMATGEMEVVLFLICFQTPSGGVRGWGSRRAIDQAEPLVVPGFCRLPPEPRQMISGFCRCLRSSEMLLNVAW